MNKFKKILEILKCNLGSLLGFELLFKISTTVIFMPLLIGSFNLIMKATGYHYLSLENVFSFLLNPLTILMLLVLMVIIAAYTTFDVVTIITILDSSYQNKEIKILDAIKISLRKCRNLFHFYNIPLALLVFFLIPFLNFGLSSSLFFTIRIPEFIADFIIENHFLFICIILIFSLLIVILLRWIYALHYFTLENVNFKTALQKSQTLSRHHHFQDGLTLAITQFATALLYFIFILIGILVIISLDKIFQNIIVIKSILAAIIWTFITISLLIVTFLSIPISYAAISVLYYFHKTESHEKIPHIKIKEYRETGKSRLIFKRFLIAFTVIAIIFGSIMTYDLYKGNYNLNIEYLKTVAVTAHRGASIDYPENTFAAFTAAKELGADWIELDAQQTKDGKIIVTHDANLKRITGINQHTWEMTYDEIKDLDAGSFLDPKFQNERIPLLKDVIVWAKNNNMKLNIELKPTGHEQNLEEAVIKIITDLDFEKDCVVTSQSYNILEHIKNLAPDIVTVYVMSLAYGDISSLEAADHFSIEATNITSSLVSQIHQAGKQIYAWTINTEENINRMIDLKVDNIVTDDITLAKNIIYADKTNNVINEYTKFIHNLLNQ